MTQIAYFRKKNDAMRVGRVKNIDELMKKLVQYQNKTKIEDKAIFCILYACFVIFIGWFTQLYK